MLLIVCNGQQLIGAPMDAAIIALTSQIVSAFVSKNSVQAADLPALISSVYQSLQSAGQPQAAAESLTLPPCDASQSV